MLTFATHRPSYAVTGEAEISHSDLIVFTCARGFHRPDESNQVVILKVNIRESLDAHNYAGRVC